MSTLRPRLRDRLTFQSCGWVRLVRGNTAARGPQAGRCLRSGSDYVSRNASGHREGACGESAGAAAEWFPTGLANWRLLTTNRPGSQQVPNASLHLEFPRGQILSSVTGAQETRSPENRTTQLVWPENATLMRKDDCGPEGERERWSRCQLLGWTHCFPQ